MKRIICTHPPRENMASRSHPLNANARRSDLDFPMSLLYGGKNYCGLVVESKLKHSETLNQWSGENPEPIRCTVIAQRELYIRVNVTSLNVILYMYYNIARMIRKMCTHGHLCAHAFRNSDVLECHMRARFTALGIIRRVISYVQACRTYYIILYCILCRPCVRVQHSQTR